MKYVVVGVERSQGDYNGQKYDNIKLHCFTDSEIEEGHKTEILKVKNNFAERVELNGNNLKYFRELVGCEIKPFFDRFGGIECIRVMSTDGAI